MERSASTVMTFGINWSTEEGTSLTANLLSTVQHKDVFDRVIRVVVFLLFSCAVLYVVSKHI
ncbi:hypothetical protein NE237_015085 [Protea cynaroides]|uniref:Uncharacterized protein n=1 Tax=Protea cynaroides TaxID=273540 RepID=A0A9Q0QQW5_9MAGN|nr:hypothetical protein NE237_015085 [Protea cynaroides]